MPTGEEVDAAGKTIVEAVVLEQPEPVQLPLSNGPAIALSVTVGDPMLVHFVTDCEYGRRLVAFVIGVTVTGLPSAEPFRSNATVSVGDVIPVVESPEETTPYSVTDCPGRVGPPAVDAE